MHASVTKIIDFPAAHSNTHHSGHCSNVHGHTWTLEITCRGRVSTDESSDSFGMVLDFGDIKAAYRDLVEPFVEHQNLNDTLDLPEYTTEHIAAWIWSQLRPALPTLHRVRLWEGKSSYAEFENGDQLR
jgi:6-pyruvoyltetrahydropterin/6-carboxytetrahydropterin synthase